MSSAFEGGQRGPVIARVDGAAARDAVADKVVTQRRKRVNVVLACMNERRAPVHLQRGWREVREEAPTARAWCGAGASSR